MNSIPQREPPDFDEVTRPGKLTGLMCRCLELVEADFQELTWRAFLLTAIESQTAPEAAQTLGMTACAVRQAKSRVLRRIREEFEGLVDGNI